MLYDLTDEQHNIDKRKRLMTLGTLSQKISHSKLDRARPPALLHQRGSLEDEAKGELCSSFAFSFCSLLLLLLLLLCHYLDSHGASTWLWWASGVSCVVSWLLLLLLRPRATVSQHDDRPQYKKFSYHTTRRARLPVFLFFFFFFFFHLVDWSGD
ncbi:hypothetical protein IWX50DRAFT_159838 [Phyllosticta citricarpa]